MIPTLYLEAALLLTLIAAILAFVRVLIGPAVADRLLALDVGSAFAVVLIAALAMLADAGHYLDLAIAVALLGMISTLAAARYLAQRKLSPKAYGEETRKKAQKEEKAT